MASPGRASARKRILVVNCYIDDTRASIGRSRKLPQGMGPAYLAGAFSPELCDVRLYSELFSGPLEDERLLGWPDMLVLTGLTTALDRMRHLAAYARTKNPRIVVVAGGHAVRALPQYCSSFFDFCCVGDVEELQAVVADAFGRPYASERMQPRFDLAPWVRRVAHLESTRYCNFRCSFCALAAEGRHYQTYDIENLRRDILSLGRRFYLSFIDNNFFGSDRRHFLARLELLRDLWKRGQFDGWGAGVTGDFFLDEDNLRRAREAGCGVLFSGLESFDADWLRRNNKAQNTRLDPVEPIRRTLEAGIAFSYGLVFDVTTRRLADIRRELDFIVGTPEITLPAYLSVTVPMLKTPFFYDCLRDRLLLPNTRVRDLDSSTLSLRPLDPLDEVAAFVRDLQTFRGWRRHVPGHMAAFARRYRSSLTPVSLALALSGAALLCAPVAASGPTRWRGLRVPRTHVSSTDILDAVYEPAFRIDSRFAHYFTPTRLTDARGELAEEVAADLAPQPHLAGVGGERMNALEQREVGP
jgi:hypothetical protein